MIKRLFGTKKPASQTPVGVPVAQCKADLVKGVNTDSSAKRLGDIALANYDPNALLALWEAVCETHHLAAIIDPCAYTVGRIATEAQDPSLVDLTFNILTQSTKTGSESIVDKFAYTAGQVYLQAKTGSPRQRAKRFILDHCTSADPLVHRCYNYTRHRVEL